MGLLNDFKRVRQQAKSFQPIYHPPNRNNTSIFEDIKHPPTRREKEYYRRKKIRDKVVYVITGRR